MKITKRIMLMIIVKVERHTKKKVIRKISCIISV